MIGHEFILSANTSISHDIHMCLQTFNMFLFLMYMQVHLHFFWARSFFMLDNMVWSYCCGNSQWSWPCLCILHSELRQNHVIFSLNPCLIAIMTFLLFWVALFFHGTSLLQMVTELSRCGKYKLKLMLIVICSFTE